MSFLKILSRLAKAHYFLLVLSLILIIPFTNFLSPSICWTATYYIDATNGIDSNNGTSTSAPWKTIAKVKASKFNPGDQILFKRGETWREQLTIPSSGSSGNPIIFGAYGSGNKPKLLGSVVLSGSSNWQQSSSSIWKSVPTISVDVGNLILNNESSCGKKKSSLNSLGSQGDFYYDPATGYLYLYSTSNPGIYFTAIEAAKNYHGVLISGKNHVTVQDFDVRYWGGHGVQIDGYSANCDNIIIQRNDISYIGGSYQFGTERYGNGIEQWDNGTNVIVRYNVINQVYDSALTSQAAQASATIANISYYYNIVTNCDNGFCIFNPGTSSTTTNVSVSNNLFYNNGGGWSHAQRSGYDATIGSALLMFNSANGNASNCIFKNNISHTSANEHIYVYDPNDLAGWTIDYNVYYPDGGSAFVRNVTNTTFAGWKTATSQDAHSIITDPKLTSGSDFHLQSTSPAINTGTNVGLTQDFDGNPISGVPDIGVFEFIQKPLPPQNVRHIPMP